MKSFDRWGFNNTLELYFKAVAALNLLQHELLWDVMRWLINWKYEQKDDSRRNTQNTKKKKKKKKTSITNLYHPQTNCKRFYKHFLQSYSESFTDEVNPLSSSF